MKASGYNSLESWLAVIFCAIIGFFTLSPMRLAGVFFVILVEGYGVDRTEASVPIVVFGTLRGIAGPFAAFLGETFGFRAVTLTGCTLCAIGIGSCFFAENITIITICLGVVNGLGLAFGNTLISTILRLHFTEHINLVNGIVLTASCMGALVLSPVILYLYTAYGTNGMFLILGGIFLNCLPAAMLLKHPNNDGRSSEAKHDENNCSKQANTYHQNIGFVSDEKDQYKTPTKNFFTEQKSLKVYSISSEYLRKQSNRHENINNGYSGNLAMKFYEKVNTHCLVGKTESKQLQNSQLNLCNNTEPSININSDKNVLNTVTQSSEAKSVTTNKTRTTCTSFRLFADPTFHFIMIVQSIHAFVTTLSWTIIVDYARDKGISNAMSVYFAMFIPVAEIVGNMSLNWITDRQLMTRTNFSLTCFLILIVDSIYIIWTYNFALMMIGVIVFSIVSGAVISTFPGIIIEYIEEKYQNMALASRYSLYAFLCLLKTPLISYYRETLGSYDWIYVIIMIGSLICCILVKLTPTLASYRNKRKQLKEIYETSHC